MTINSLYTNDQLPTTSAQALREFNERFLAAVAMSQPDTWPELFGLVDSTNALDTTFPISQMGLKFKKAMGEDSFRKALEKSIDLKVEEFQEGIAAPLLELFMSSFRWRRWKEGPALLLLAEKMFVQESIALALEAGTSGTNYDGVPFFSDSHPCNLGDSSFGTFSNYQSSGKAFTLVNLEAEITLMKGVKDENGKKLGLKPDTIFVPSEKAEAVTNLLSQTIVLDSSAGVSNVYNGKFNIVEITDFTDANDWYLLDSKMIKMGVSPWAALRFNAPQSLGVRNFDESSDHFKKKGEIMVSNHVWWGIKLAMPHAIRKIVGA